MLKSILYLLIYLIVKKIIFYLFRKKIQPNLINIISNNVENKHIDNFTLIPYINVVVNVLDYFFVYILQIININFYKLINFYNKNIVLQFISSNFFFYKLYISNLISIINNINYYNLNYKFIYIICNFFFLRIVLYEIIYKNILNKNNYKLMPISTFIHLFELINYLLKYYKKKKFTTKNNIIIIYILWLIIFIYFVEKIIFKVKALYIKVKSKY